MLCSLRTCLLCSLPGVSQATVTAGVPKDPKAKAAAGIEGGYGEPTTPQKIGL